METLNKISQKQIDNFLLKSSFREDDFEFVLFLSYLIGKQISF